MKVRERIQQVSRWLKRVVTQPLDELNRWQRAIRFAYDLARYGARQLSHDRAQQMAAALAFRALFGLLPVMVVATVVVRALGGIEQWFIEPLQELFVSAGLDKVTIVPPPEVADGAASLDVWLGHLVRESQQINMAAIGWVGFAVMIYAAIGLLVTIENSFNTIYRAPQGRPWIRQIPLYWFILTLSPAAIVLSTYLNSRIETWMEPVESWNWVSLVAGVTWSVLVTWLFMFIVYMLFPNTTVAVRPALIGALVAALLLEIGKWTLGAYMTNALSISKLYGSLGLIPLFMFWVYLMWLAVLFGLEVSATLQMLHGRQLDEVERKRPQPGITDPVSVLALMEIIAEQFGSGQPTSLRQLAEATSLPDDVVLQIVQQLESSGFLHRLSGQEVIVSLAQPPESITADHLIEVGFHMADQTAYGRRSVLTERLRDVQKVLAARTSLATLASPETT